MKNYPVTEPHLDATDREHLLDAFDSGWISSQGPYLARFEHDFAQFCRTEHALATANGTVALHLALLALGVGRGDEVIVPTFTYVATANAVRYCNATPVLVDCEVDTWNIDPAAVERAITPRTVGILPVHLYGMPCDMRALRSLAMKHKLWIVEDAAEAHGATIDGQRVGSFGEISSFSLYGNKIVTTGEGGVVTTNDAELARKMALYRGQGMDPTRRYWFDTVGYNYRMTNLAAALGVSQMAKIERLIAAHRQVAAWYREFLHGCDEFSWQAEHPGVESVHWLASLRWRDAENRPELRDLLMSRLTADGIDTRPFFYPMHAMPVHRSSERFPVADLVASSGLNLPSSPRLTRADVEHVASRLVFHARAVSAAETRATSRLRALPKIGVKAS
ncbi:MAG: DegT/DnrJ/EryC1/StrS family aminotransferase [Planctomycetota bacterium]|nr:DegT/DnrJ/EryC1/StrS family aminotransferase [Planctomycetota bacterium]